MSAPLHPRIYVACLAAYNAGHLHGTWIELSDHDLDSVHQRVRAMLASSPEPLAEEYAIHDHEGFGPCRIGEYDSLEAVHRIATGISAHGRAFAAWASIWNERDLAELDRFEDMFVGSYESMQAYAEELLDAFGIEGDPQYWAPELIAPYVEVNMAAFSRDLESQYQVVEDDYEVHVFWA